MRSHVALVALSLLQTSCAMKAFAPESGTAPVLATRAASSGAQASDAILLTVFLRHDQSKSLVELQQIEDEQGFWKSFPPPGTSVVSWYVMMGIGQVVTLEVPASRLRDVNVALERTAWKAFRTEFYPTYDLWPAIRNKLANPARKALQDDGHP
jgi:hypothetical protein